MHTNFAPQLKGRYLTSNVNITVADKQGNPVSIPLGSKCIPTSIHRDPKNTRSDRFAKFKTRKYVESLSRLVAFVNAFRQGPPSNGFRSII